MENEKKELEAITLILKKALIMMMIKKWNGKDFTNIDELGNMADDIIEVVATIGKET